MVPVNVYLESEPFGVEYFQYDTKAEAIAGFKRLLREADKHYKQDGIPRRVGFQVGMPEDKDCQP